MQTSFAPERLADPQMRESEKILRTCVHCGFCTATCPTYVLLGDELDSPRGRIYLIKDMLENDKPASDQVVKHVDRCLSCLSCMTTCPSGVHYMHLVDHARAHIEKTHRRAWSDRAMRATLAAVLPYPGRFRLALAAAALARPFRGLLGRLPAVGPRLRAMLELAPARAPTRPPKEATRAPAGARRVALLEGCAQPALAPAINAAARRVLGRAGVAVVDAPAAGCCGALVHHMGREHDALAFAKRNVDAWTALIEDGGLDAIVITTSGCGTTIKDYGFMLREDAAYRDKAARVSALAKDVSEYLADLDLAFEAPNGRVVAYHAACSLQHGQQVRDAPKALLRAAGYRLREPVESHICCGSAGVYNILQPEIAGRLRARKAANLARTKPEIVAAGNIGCITQIAAGLATPVVHTVELLDWAQGGPTPEAVQEAGFPA